MKNILPEYHLGSRGTKEFVADEVVGVEMTAGAMRSFQVGASTWGGVLEKSKTQGPDQNT
jgi:hypothetical protein